MSGQPASPRPQPRFAHGDGSPARKEGLCASSMLPPSARYRYYIYSDALMCPPPWGDLKMFGRHIGLGGCYLPDSRDKLGFLYQFGVFLSPGVISKENGRYLTHVLPGIRHLSVKLSRCWIRFHAPRPDSDHSGIVQREKIRRTCCWRYGGKPVWIWIRRARCD